MLKLKTIASAAFLGAVVAMMSLTSGHAEAAYPSELVRVIVPAAGGSTTDVLARILADRLSAKWGKAVIVENVSGGGMNIGAARVARSAPDGYTLMVAPPTPLATSHLLYKELEYNPTKFAPIAMLARTPLALVVRKNFPATSVRELVDYAKAHPGKLTYGSQGAGSTAHLTASLLDERAGIKMVHVPYRGAAPILNDVMAGQIDMFFDTLTTSVPLLQAGKVKVLAVTGLERSAALPDVPTVVESGLPGFQASTWFALVAPPGTPSSIVDKINRDVVEILQQKDVGDKIRGLRLEPMAGTPGDAEKFLEAERSLWGEVIRNAKITLQ